MVHTVILEEIVTGALPSAAHVIKYPPLINYKVTHRLISIDMNTVGVSPRSTNQVLTGSGTSAPPIRIRSQEIGSPRGSIGTQKVRNNHPFKTSIIQFSSKHFHPTPIFSKAIGRKTVSGKSDEVNCRCEIDIGHNSFFDEIPNFIYFGLLPANEPDKLKSIIVPNTITTDSERSESVVLRTPRDRSP